MTSRSCARLCLTAALLAAASCAPEWIFAAEGGAGAIEVDKPAQQLPAVSGQPVKWALHQPGEATISYRGAANFDGAGTQGGTMMYPAPNVAGLLAAILTHAAIAESVKDSEKSRIQAEADKVLEPYRGVLSALSYRRLMQDTLETLETTIAIRLIDSPEEAINDWLVEVKPAFFLTQDQSALILDNTVVVIPPGTSSKGKSERSVRVVSFPIDEGNPSAYWLEADGAKLKQQSANLLAHSLRIGLETAAAFPAEEAAFRTIRYLEGKSEKIERAQMVRQQCDRLVIKNLRGMWMSVPVTPHSGTAERATSCNS